MSQYYMGRSTTPWTNPRVSGSDLFFQINSLHHNCCKKEKYMYLKTNPKEEINNQSTDWYHDQSQFLNDQLHW